MLVVEAGSEEVVASIENVMGHGVYFRVLSERVLNMNIRLVESIAKEYIINTI